MKRTVTLFFVVLTLSNTRSYAAENTAGEHTWSQGIQIVLDETKPLEHPRGDRLPLYLWPAMDPGDLDRETAEYLVAELDRRGVGIVCSWTPDNRDESLRKALTVARAQIKLGVPVNINATSILYSFFNGDIKTAHVDADGNPFFDDSFGDRHKMGCPFTLDSRRDAIRERVDWYVKAYADAGISIDFIWADWEVDGPIEFNRAHEASKRCVRCREHVGNIDNFLEFQKSLRDIRSDLQRYVFTEPVLERFPDALVGNYAVYPHNGYRYWYDYFEFFVEGQPYIADQDAKYRLWYNDFPGTDYTFAMPVVYPWARLFSWYDYNNADYRWFYNMLLVASNACASTPETIPIISFVHWHMINPEKYPAPGLTQFSEDIYRELLWHMLLRGTDTFYLWCGRKEFAKETRLLHEIYAAAQEYGDFIESGTPVTFAVPKEPGTVISALRLGNRLLVRRTDFAGSKDDVELRIGVKSVVVKTSPGKCVVYDID